MREPLAEGETARWGGAYGSKHARGGYLHACSMLRRPGLKGSRTPNKQTRKVFKKDNPLCMTKCKIGYLKIKEIVNT